MRLSSAPFLFVLICRLAFAREYQAQDTGGQGIAANGHLARNDANREHFTRSSVADEGGLRNVPLSHEGTLCRVSSYYNDQRSKKCSLTLIFLENHAWGRVLRWG